MLSSEFLAQDIGNLRQREWKHGWRYKWRH